MFNHDKGKQNSWVMWVMALCCILPALLIILLSVGGKAIGAPTWIIFGGIIIIAIIHFFIMNKSHKHSDKNNNSHSDHNGCH